MSFAAPGIPPLDVSRDDDPRVVAEAATEDYSLHVVPRTWRLGRARLLLAWSSMATAVFWLYLAALVALTVGTTNALIGIVLSVIVYSAVAYVINRAAAESGLTVALFSRGMFGFVGASLATLLFGATCIYYFVFESSIVAVAAQSFFGSRGLDLDIEIWYLIVVLYSIPLVLKGVRVWLDRFNGFLLPLYAIGVIAVLIWVTSDAGGYSGAWASFEPEVLPVEGPGWLFAFTTWMGVYVIFMYQMDYARLGRTEDLGFSSTVTFGPVFYLVTYLLNALIGIYLVHALRIEQLGEGELAASIVGVTGLLGLVWLVITQSRINTANLYLASTNLQSFSSRVLQLTVQRGLWVFVAAAIGYVIMLTNVFSFILDALTYQGIAIVAWVAIALVHVGYLRRQQRLKAMEFRPGRVPAFNPAGLGAWIVATALGVVLENVEKPFFGTFGLLLVFVVAAGGYGLLLQAAPQRWFSLDRPYDPAEEVADPWEDRVRCHSCDRYYVAREIDRDPTANHEAICSACAAGLPFVRAVAREARAGYTPATKDQVPTG